MSKKPRKIKAKKPPRQKYRSVQQTEIPKEFQHFCRNLVANSHHSLDMQQKKILLELENLKANMVALTNELERTGTLDKDAFKAEYWDYMQNKAGIVEDGRMQGRAIFSLYNMS